MANSSPADEIRSVVDTLFDRRQIDVGSFIPSGYQEYLRLFHPATRDIFADDRTIDRFNTVLGAESVRWADIAAANGRDIAAEMRALDSGNCPSGYANGGDLWDNAPVVGELPQLLGKRLCEILERHTQTNSQIFLGVWDGYAGVSYPADVVEELELPLLRRYRLYQRTLDDVKATFSKASNFRPPNLWWSADRTWCVATEIDFRWTYVGGSSACMAEVASDPLFETLRTFVDEGNFMEDVER